MSDYGYSNFAAHCEDSEPKTMPDNNTEFVTDAPPGLSFNEFYDWLQFDSPDHYQHSRALDTLRYCASDSQDRYALSFYKSYCALHGMTYPYGA